MNRIRSEEDIVFHAKRHTLTYNRVDRKEIRRHSPLLSLEQSIVKETKDGKTSYTVYDILSLKSNSFNIDKKAFLIADKKAFEMELQKIESDFARSLSEDTKNVLTSDSSTVSVVTGYSEINRKIVRFSYSWSDETLAAIKNADQIRMRYYSGPNMITVTLKRKNLRKIKQLIDKS
jgi:hypothetical protein